MEIPDLEKLNNSISVLNRTRESLGATACPDSSGHLLDKALAKQIAVRKAELDKLLPNNVSVIVRTSTPDPEVLCEDNHHNFLCARFFRASNNGRLLVTSEIIWIVF